jgi:hypothetical protein
MSNRKKPKLVMDAHLPGWAREYPKIVEYAIEVAHQRIGRDPVLKQLSPAVQVAVLVALIETWFSGASERRAAGPLELDAEAFAQSLAEDAMTRIGEGMPPGAVAKLMRRVACIVEERAAAEMERPPGRLDS